MTKAEFSLKALKLALATLEEGLGAPPKNALERDGVIQRFEYTFELSWKMIRKGLLLLGKNQVSASPKLLIRDAFSESWITSVEQWFEFLEARNDSSHTYDQRRSDWVYSVAVRFPKEVHHLILELEKAVKSA